MDIVRYCFNIACFAAAFGMTLLWICRYVQDRDSVEVDLKPFDFPIGQYPTLSFCFMNPFENTHLELKTKDNWVEDHLEICSELGRSETPTVVGRNSECKTLTFDSSLFSNGEKENRRTISCPMSKILWTGASTINATIKIIYTPN